MSDSSATAKNTKFSLYYYDSCPFCARVVRSLNKVNVEVELRNVMTDSAHRSALQQATKRTTVPCLRIDSGTNSKWMFESMDIMRFLQSQ